MNTIANIETDKLRDLYSLPGPVLSVYFRLGEVVGDDVPARLQALTGQLRRHHAGTAATDVVARTLRATGPGHGSVGMFVGADGSHWSTSMPDAVGPDLAVVGLVPHLVPLLAWQQAHPAAVLAVVDRTGADITTYPPEAGKPIARTVTGPDDEIERNAPGGWSQPRYQNRAEDSWQHNAGAVAEAVTEALQSGGARLLLLAGDVRAVHYLTEQLPAWVLHEVSLRPVGGGRSQDGSWSHRSQQVAEQTSLAARAHTSALLEELTQHAGPGGRAVEGAAATVHALSRGQVRTLLITDQAEDQRVAWFGPGPTDVCLRRIELLHAGLDPKRGPLVDLAIRSAILTDADVRILQADAPGGPRQGLGALCRFP